MYIKKLKKEMTECRIIQVSKVLHKKESHSTVKYNQLIKQKLGLVKGQNVINLYLKITENCNFDCVFCSQNCEDTKNKIDFDKAKYILDQAKNLGFINIYYTGGEPLLNKDLCKIVEYGRSLGFNQCIITNGYLLDKNVNILEYIDKIGISLHGDKDTYELIVQRKNVYEKIISNIELVRAKNIPININYTTCEHNSNVKQLQYVANFCKDKKLEMTVARLNYIGKASRTDQQDVNTICKYINQLNNKGYDIKLSNCLIPCVVEDKYRYLCHGCGAAISTIAIDSLGNVSICASSKRIEGNVFKSNLKTILKKIKSAELKRLNSLPTCCKICKYMPLCKGGCKIEVKDGYSCDYLLNRKYDVFTRSILNKFVVLKLDKIIINEKQIILPFPLRILDKKYYNFIKELDGSKKVRTVIEGVENKDELMQLLFCLNEDNYLIIKE